MDLYGTVQWERLAVCKTFTQRTSAAVLLEASGTLHQAGDRRIAVWGRGIPTLTGLAALGVDLPTSRTDRLAGELGAGVFLLLFLLLLTLAQLAAVRIILELPVWTFLQTPLDGAAGD